MRLARRSYVRARQHAGKPGVRVDVVELSGGDEAQIAARTPAALIGPGEDPIFSPHRDRP